MKEMRGKNTKANCRRKALIYFHDAAKMLLILMNNNLIKIQNHISSSLSQWIASFVLWKLLYYFILILKFLNTKEKDETKICAVSILLLLRLSAENPK